MANPVCEVLLTDAPLTAPAEQPERETGAVVDFWGVVRATENGAEIAGIDYEAHRAMAEHQLHALARDAAEQFPLKSVSIRHRIGFVAAGEPSLLLRGLQWASRGGVRCGAMDRRSVEKAGADLETPAAPSDYGCS
jgi:hypothetical protein